MKRKKAGDDKPLKKKRKNGIWGLVFIIILLLIAITVSGINERKYGTQIDKLINDGHDLVAGASYERAMASYKKAIELNPLSIEAYKGIAEVYTAKTKEFITDENGKRLGPLEILAKIGRSSLGMSVDSDNQETLTKDAVSSLLNVDGNSEFYKDALDHYDEVIDALDDKVLKNTTDQEFRDNMKSLMDKAYDISKDLVGK